MLLLFPLLLLLLLLLPPVIIFFPSGAEPTDGGRPPPDSNVKPVEVGVGALPAENGVPGAKEPGAELGIGLPTIPKLPSPASSSS